jgi:FixJ family two-component response regulator
MFRCGGQRTEGIFISVQPSNTLISIVDDDRSMSRMLSRAITAEGLDVASFGSAEQFLESERAEECACLILDMNLPGMSGEELQQRLIAEGLDIPTIFISADAGEATQQRVLDAGAVAFFSKPFGIESLLSTLRSVLCLTLI